MQHYPPDHLWTALDVSVFFFLLICDVHLFPFGCSHTHQKIAEGAKLEADWNATLATYEQKYPAEAAAFKQLVSGKLPEGWEKALPVSTPRCSCPCPRIQSSCTVRTKGYIAVECPRAGRRGCP